MRQAAAVLGVVGAASIAFGQIDISTGPFSLSDDFTFTITVEKDAPGQVVDGFSIWADYVGDGGGTWASDTALTIKTPDGQSVKIGGFDGDSDLDYDYQGGVSADPGVYMSGPHFGWIDGGAATGVYTVTVEQDFGIGIFNDITVHIGRVPAPGAAALLGLGGLAAFRRRR